MAESEIFRNYNFKVDLGGGTQCAYFTDVTGLSVKIETIDYREGGAGPAVRKLEGRVTYGNITLKWGLTQNRDIWDWLLKTMEGQPQRREVAIVLLKQYGQDQEAARWSLTKAYPCGWVGSDLRALDQAVAIESLELAHEGLQRVA